MTYRKYAEMPSVNRPTVPRTLPGLPLGCRQRSNRAGRTFHYGRLCPGAGRRAHTYFTSSLDGGKTWSAPVRIGPARLTMSLAEWWIDGALGIDAAGNLYATWDTQGATADIGWLAYSTSHGRTWSSLRRVTPDRDNRDAGKAAIGDLRGDRAFLSRLSAAEPRRRPSARPAHRRSTSGRRFPRLRGSGSGNSRRDPRVPRGPPSPTSRMPGP
jgi:hypothetical protein